MPRRNYLVSYDVSDDKRRNKLFNLLMGEGDHVQFSVFFCEFSATELARFRGQARETIHQQQDQVLILDLGPVERPLDQGLEVLGIPYEPYIRTFVV